MKKSGGIALLFLWLSAAGSPAQPPVKPYVGEAYDLAQGRHVYTEEHSERILAGKHVGTHSLFKNPQGLTMAERDLDFSRSLLKPDYTFKDLRNGYEEGARVGQDGKVRVYFRDSLKAPFQEKHLHVPEPCVINDGLNRFLKANWKSLEAGRRIPLNLVVPARLDFYRFVAYVDPGRVISRKEAGGRTAKAVVIEPESRFLRMVLPPLVAYYDLANLRMVRYQGLVNLNDARGKSLRVRIDYAGLGP
jgi:hypothetical protein